MITFADGTTLKISKKPIGIGGEGKVYRVANPEKSGLVAKIYKSLPSVERQNKIKIMSARSDASIRDVCTWPLEPLIDSRSGKICGFIMEDMSDSEPVHHFYSPSWRMKHHPRLSWALVVDLCSNVAAGLSKLHDLSIIIGDINPNSIRIMRSGKAVFIDTDSFQISDNGRLYHCGVGVPAFTPPEVLEMSQSYESIRRTENHDNFGLALILFHLLFMGRHPFSGVSIDNGEWSLEQNIKQYRYAYSERLNNRGILPPPLSVHPRLVADPAITNAFQNAFKQQTPSVSRPDSRLWYQLLAAQRKRLQMCAKNFRHAYDQSTTSCIWCELERKGIAFFGSDEKSFQSPQHRRVQFQYQTIDHIQVCTGKASSEIENAMRQLTTKEPFDLVTADRLALILTGYPSIRRAYDSRYNGRVNDSLRPIHDAHSANTARKGSHQSSSQKHTTSTTSIPTSKGIAYSSKKDVSNCTGRPEDDVQTAMEQLGCKEPFDLIIADRLAFLLTGDSSIVRAYRKTRHHLQSKSRQGVNQCYPNIFSAKAPTNSTENNHSITNSTNGLAYSTKSEISKCTGKSEEDVQKAIDQLKCKEPFNLITADRLALILTGDPSIRRAYLRSG